MLPGAAAVPTMGSGSGIASVSMIRFVLCQAGFSEKLLQHLKVTWESLGLGD